MITSEEQAAALARVRDTGFDLLDDHAVTEGLLEARDEQIAAQVVLLTQVDLPLLQVRRSTLCVPFIGEFDGFRTAQIIDGLLKAAIARGVRTVVIDLTGALFRDTSTAIDLARVFQALRLIGVRGVLSGVSPGLAPWLAEMHGSLRDAPASGPRGRARRGRAQEGTMTEDPARAIKTVEMRSGTIWLRADGIVYHRNMKGVRHTLADVDAHFAGFTEVAGGERRPLLVDARGEFLTEPGVRERYGKPMATGGPLALAMLIDSGYGRTFGNLALAFSSQKLPTRLFNDEESALTWLRKFLRTRR